MFFRILLCEIIPYLLIYEIHIMLSTLKKLFYKNKKKNAQKLIELPAINYDDFWNEFSQTYEKFAAKDDDLPNIDDKARLNIDAVIKPIFIANTLKEQQLELRQIGQKIILHKVYITAYCDNTDKFSSSEQYFNFLKFFKVDCPIENKGEVISILQELSLWHAVIIIIAVVLDDCHENSWFQCYEMLYKHHAKQLIEYGEIFKEILDGEIKQDESCSEQVNALSNLILLEGFMKPFLNKISQGDQVSYKLHSIARALEDKVYMKGDC